MSASGWTCPSCGSWVPQNSWHHCGGFTNPPVTSPVWIQPIVPWDRIVTALERIAAALEGQPEPGEERP